MNDTSAVAKADAVAASLADVFEIAERLQCFSAAKAHPGVHEANAKRVHQLLVVAMNEAMAETLNLSASSHSAPPESKGPTYAALEAELAQAKAHIESLQAAQTVLADELAAARTGSPAPPPQAPPASPEQ